ncbi:methyltransferase (TIGR00027 family) [Desulfobotulus alkaliphilus]|uniref:Methyltransferase (TIGR00027 family) n=1 Tax=Desulfobotulus alkaliphilus TaxID=622671 RepID=A0A562S1W1_9BACT|nr:class I SAM-dependent methyltransferase [Desulfobotulus alkaliphilus]TWI75307.1 methyltransferase (TIGR00027 family) [Desulfobotulus alkaliphilus]
MFSCLDAVSRTLLLPLYFRAEECDAPSPIVHDPMAKELVKKIPYDFNVLKKHTLMKTATLMRVAAVDRMVDHFLKRHPDAVVVNVGAGLDTRFFRMDTGRMDWYEMDLPEVMKIRRLFFGEDQRYHMVDASLKDPDWHRQILCANRPLLIIVEGVLMYLEEACVRNFINQILRNFSSSFLIFDAVSPYQVIMSAFNPTLMLTGARFKWGMNAPDELESWRNDIRMHESHYYLGEMMPQMGWLNFLTLYPSVRFGFSAQSYMLGKPLTAEPDDEDRRGKNP